MTDIVCTLNDDDARGRLEEYACLFADAFLGRERTATGLRWRLGTGPRIAERARDLAARENACCPFLRNTVTATGDELVWEMTAGDDPAAQAVVDLFYDLPVGAPGAGRSATR